MGEPAKLFFVHLMKTGGASFRARLRTVVPDNRIFPNTEDDADLLSANMDIQALLGLDAARRERTDVYTGHFPFVVTRLFPEPVWTAAIVRDPLGRTISYLKHCRRYEPRFAGWELEAIYDDPMKYPTLIRNYQAKLFAMCETDRLETQLDVVEVDEDRLRVAKDNLEAVDVLGLHERYDEFVTAVCGRTGWSFGQVGRWRESRPERVPDSLRERILADNSMDVRFYEHARQVVADRDVEPRGPSLG